MENERIGKICRQAVESGELAGCSLLVKQRGEEKLFVTSGYACMETQERIRRDHIFRLYSQTKPVISAAVALLIDRGELDAFEEVRTFLGGFENQKVWVGGEKVPVKRNCRVMDLLGMMSGLVYPREDEAGREMAELFEENERAMDEGGGMCTVDFVNAMGQRGLAFHPGQSFRYGVSADVLGAIVEIVSGKKLGQFLKEEFFDPLGMKDTAFFVPEEKQNRLVHCYQRTGEGVRPYKVRHLCVRDHTSSPAFESGGAGLYSTVDDYAAFAEMLMNRGVYRGRRILSRAAVDFMTSPQTEPEGWENLAGYSYGKLMRICTCPGKALLFSEMGEYGWDGWLGTYFANLPHREMTILFFQNTKDTGTGPALRKVRNACLGLEE